MNGTFLEKAFRKNGGQYLTVNEVGDYFGVKPKVIYGLIAKGSLKRSSKKDPSGNPLIRMTDVNMLTDSAVDEEKRKAEATRLPIMLCAQKLCMDVDTVSQLLDSKGFKTSDGENIIAMQKAGKPVFIEENDLEIITVAIREESKRAKAKADLEDLMKSKKGPEPFNTPKLVSDKPPVVKPVPPPQNTFEKISIKEPRETNISRDVLSSISPLEYASRFIPRGKAEEMLGVGSAELDKMMDRDEVQFLLFKLTGDVLILSESVTKILSSVPDLIELSNTDRIILYRLMKGGRSPNEIISAALNAVELAAKN